MSTIYADSASRVDVASAFTAAANGDIVIVPAGNETWASALTLTKGITLEGGFGGDTIITCTDGTFLSYDPDAAAIAGDYLFTMTGFIIDGNDAGLNNDLLMLRNFSNTVSIRVKVGLNTFRDHKGQAITVWSQEENTGGQVRGVIYSNTFDRCNIIIRPFGGNTDTIEWTTFDHSDAVFGSADNLYFEDNVIQYSTAATRTDPGWTECGQCGRIVMRYNYWNMANSSANTEYWDVHGFQYWPGDSRSSGTMNVEYYGNIFISCTGYRWLHHRAYKGLYFNNRMAGSSSPDFACSQYDGSCYVDTDSDYSEIEGLYAWNNWLNGSLIDLTVDENNCGTLVENVRFWNYDSSFDGTVGIGCGDAAPSIDCTTGVAYWVTSYVPAATPPTTLEDMRTYCQAGKLYKATSTNSWSLFYEPYTYPHPLRGETETVTRFAMIMRS
jgi:hypothetical protein